MQLNHNMVITAPTILSEVLDQAYEVLQTAAHLQELLGEMRSALVGLGARAQEGQVLQPKDLMEHYWPLNSRGK